MRLLLVEDKDSFRRTLLKALEGTAWEVFEADEPSKALEILETNAVEVMVTDLRMPGFSGIELLKRARRLNPSMRIILMSAFGEPKDIVEALSFGADDFFPKPFDLDFFIERLEKMRTLASSPPPNQREPWVTASEAMRSIEKNLRAAAETNRPTLFSGEAGTGRGRSARRLHVLRHPSAPFRSESARGLLPDSLSDTFLKDLSGGSILLRDLEYVPPATLPALLSSMERYPDLCWMGTCGNPLDLPGQLSSQIGVLSMALAPLRERKEDILPIFYSHLIENCNREGRIAPVVGHEAEKELLGRDWLGNVTELVWVVTEALRVCPGGILKELPACFTLGSKSLLLPRPAKGTLNKMIHSVANSAERHFLEEALAGANGDPTLAATNLGLSAKNYIHKLRDYGISLKDV
jgi:DNA-binding NtrC family response regulator